MPTLLREKRRWWGRSQPRCSHSLYNLLPPGTLQAQSSLQKQHNCEVAILVIFLMSRACGQLKVEDSAVTVMNYQWGWRTSWQWQCGICGFLADSRQFGRSAQRPQHIPSKAEPTENHSVGNRQLQSFHYWETLFFTFSCTLRRQRLTKDVECFSIAVSHFYFTGSSPWSSKQTNLLSQV